MRRPSPRALLLGAAVVGVVGAAVVDSVRHGSSRTRPTQSVPARTAAPVGGLLVPQRQQLVGRLRRAGLQGVLYFVDQRCELEAVRLPSLAAAPAPRGGGCRAVVSPASAPPGWSLWPRDTPLAASCDGTRVVVTASAGPALPMIGGCAPAWRSDGSMTYVRRGAIVQFPRTGRAQVLRPRAQLAGMLARATGVPHSKPFRVRTIAWLGPTRCAVVAIAGSRTALAVLAGRQVAALRLDVPRAAREVRASPRGTFLVLRTKAGVVVYDARRPTLPQAQRLRGDAVTWSPDERWLAIARNAAIVLTRRRTRIILPIAARDLAWTRALG
jgi:hypothetical protein